MGLGFDEEFWALLCLNMRILNLVFTKSNSTPVEFAQDPTQKQGQHPVNQVHPLNLIGTQPELGSGPAQTRLSKKLGSLPGACASRRRWRECPTRFQRTGPRAGALSSPPELATWLPLCRWISNG
ncbi:hypothetical protein PS2_018255 [Malus domestica]